MKSEAKPTGSCLVRSPSSGYSILHNLQPPSSMALASLLNPKCSIKQLSVFLIPHISSSLFSSLCRGREHPSYSPPQQTPPIPKKVPFTVSAHGRTWQDPYHWMSSTNDPDLSHYLTQENSYAEAFMADTHHLQRTLFSEMKSRMPTSISTPPERWGPWFVHSFLTNPISSFHQSFHLYEFLIGQNTFLLPKLKTFSRNRI